MRWCFIYYKEALYVCPVELSDLSECVIRKISLRDCKKYIAVVSRPLSQDDT